MMVSPICQETIFNQGIKFVAGVSISDLADLEPGRGRRCSAGKSTQSATRPGFKAPRNNLIWPFSLLP